MRKLILFAACLMSIHAMAQAEDINAVKFVQGQTTDWYLLNTQPEVSFDASHNPVINGKTYDLALGFVETTFGTAPADTWYTVRTDGVAGNWNTICLAQNITAIDGATFWTVSGEDDNSFVLDQVTEPEAGQGYLIRFSNAELKVQYGDQVADAPVAATYGNPVQGTLTQIDAAKDNVLVGNYVVYNNQLCEVESWVGLRANRAYVEAELVSNNVPQQAPGRARAYMPKPKQTPTGLESVHDAQCTMHDGKYIINGQLVIVKDNKMYNAQGQVIF